jgi:uncharacterized protein (TIRG00374 family)
LLFAIGIYLIFPKIIGLPQTIKLLLQVKKAYIVLALGAEILSYAAAAWLLGIILSRLGHRVAFWFRFKIGSISSFAIHFFPLGSFGEGVIDFYFLKKQSVSGGSILLMLLLRTIITYSAFLLIFLYSLVVVPATPHLPLSPKLISVILFALIFFGIFYLIYSYKNERKFHQVWRKIVAIINFFAKRVHKEITPEQEATTFENIYRGLGLFGKQKRTSILTALAGISYWLGDIVCFYFVFLSFGYSIDFGVLVFGYCVATIFGLISFIPGGLGVTEATLALIYSGMGVPSEIALLSILVFRFFSFWIWIPFGLYSYLSLSKKHENS